jgi:hypothetical protein
MVIICNTCLGCLGHLINNNTAHTLGLGIGAEGKVYNAAGATMTTSVDANLGSNAGTIGAWYGVYADLGAMLVLSRTRRSTAATLIAMPARSETSMVSISRP